MDKMLVIIVDGTIKMAPYWDTIRICILDTIIRKFCYSFASPFKNPLDQKVYLQLIVFRTRDDSNALRGYFASDMDTFLSKLSGITFTDHGILPPLLEEGLIAALKLFPTTQGGRAAELARTRHCVLVTASQPSTWPKYYMVPNNMTIDIGGATGKIVERFMTNAEHLAALFEKTFISFSVICPKDIETLRKLHSAGNGFYQIAGYFPVEFKHPEFLILISEKFPEALEALRNLQENREMLPEQDSLVSLARNFTVGQLCTMIREVVSEPSIQQRSENSGEDSVRKPSNEMNTTDDSSSAVQENYNYDPVTVVEEMDLWPYEEVGSNFMTSSVAPSLQLMTSDLGPSNGRFDEIKKRRIIISAVLSQSTCSSNQPNRRTNPASKKTNTTASVFSNREPPASS